MGLEFPRLDHIAVKETPHLCKYKTGGVYDYSNLPYLCLIRKLLDEWLRDYDHGLQRREQLVGDGCTHKFEHSYLGGEVDDLNCVADVFQN